MNQHSFGTISREGMQLNEGVSQALRAKGKRVQHCTKGSSEAQKGDMHYLRVSEDGLITFTHIPAL